jgi:hypothetical protein
MVVVVVRWLGWVVGLVGFLVGGGDEPESLGTLVNCIMG